jgi:hypothetical protein
MPKTKMPQKRTLTRVTSWKWLALYLYRKAHGRRCVSCSKPVDNEDAALYTMEGLDDLILVHKNCS